MHARPNGQRQELNKIIGFVLLLVASSLIIASITFRNWGSAMDSRIVKTKDDVGDWKIKQLPIMKSLSQGFRPVYVYSRATPENMTQYSQEKQDQIILSLTKANDVADQNARVEPHFFVDLASNDALILSNTYLLELNGWDGVCIEANPEYWYRLASFRNCTIIGAAVGGNEDGIEVDFSLRGVYGGVVGLDNQKSGTDVKRNLVSISTLFNQTNVPRVIDYMSLDVEGAESLVMEYFPWNFYSFKFLTIERPKDDLKQRLKLEGYKMMLILTLYGETLWIHQPSVLLSHKEIWRIAGEYNNSYFTRVLDD